MARRRAWIAHKNVCALYRVTAAAGLLREPQPGPSWNTHTHRVGRTETFVSALVSRKQQQHWTGAVRVGGTQPGWRVSDHFHV